MVLALAAAENLKQVECLFINLTQSGASERTFRSSSKTAHAYQATPRGGGFTLFILLLNVRREAVNANVHGLWFDLAGKHKQGFLGKSYHSVFFLLLSIYVVFRT